MCILQIGRQELASIIAHASASGADCGVQVGLQAKPTANVAQTGAGSGADCGIQVGRASFA
jgi:hypothetical protein